MNFLALSVLRLIFRVVPGRNLFMFFVHFLTCQYFCVNNHQNITDYAHLWFSPLRSPGVAFFARLVVHDFYSSVRETRLTHLSLWVPPRSSYVPLVFGFLKMCQVKPNLRPLITFIVIPTLS